MFNTQKFKTKTVIQARQNPSITDTWGVSIDIGYSTVKVFSPNKIACFPSFAKKVAYGTADSSIGAVESSSISYRDENNDEYFVGANAQVAVKMNDSSSASLYVRERYFSPEFKVIARTGIALGLLQNQYGDSEGKRLHIQTGLPPEYMESDSDDLREAFMGTHKFSLKIGNKPEWNNFEFILTQEDIDIMPQPMGTLISISIDRNGGSVPQSREYFSSNMLIFDPGFGTLDTFEIKNHYLGDRKTWDNLGMRRVLQETADIIKREYNVSLSVPELENYLADGFFSQLNKKEHKSVKINFADILKDCNKKVCLEALQAVDGYYNYLADYNYLVITGGTGAAWENIIREYYKDMETLTIINGNINDVIDPVFSNVRGYYMKQLNMLKRK